MLLKAYMPEYLCMYDDVWCLREKRAVCIYWHPLTQQHQQQYNTGGLIKKNIIMFAEGLCCLLEMFKYLFSVDFNFHAIPLILVVQFFIYFSCCVCKQVCIN